MEQENHWKKKIFRALPMLLLMAIIFSFSAKTADESTESSDVIVNAVINRIEPLLGAKGQTREVLYDTVTFLVRKGAHMTEYAVLAVFSAYWLSAFSITHRTRCGAAAAISVCYAASDEFHQLFVEGRSGEVRDVLIDSAGVLLGILIVSIFYFIKNGSARHRSDSR